MMSNTDRRPRMRAGLRLLFRVVAPGAALSTPIAATGAAAETTHLTQAGFRVLYMAPVFVAMEKGFFAEHGVDLAFKEIDSGALGPAAVLSGSAQISDLDPVSVAALKAKGESPILFYNLVNRVTLDLIVRNDAIAKAGIDMNAPVLDRAKALKALTIGITRPGAPTDVYPRYFLARAGLDPQRDAHLVQIGSIAGLEAAFRSGKIDGFFLSRLCRRSWRRKASATRDPQHGGRGAGADQHLLCGPVHHLRLCRRPCRRDFRLLRGPAGGGEVAERNPDQAVDLLPPNGSAIPTRRRSSFR